MQEQFTPGPWKTEMWGEIRSADGELIADAFRDGANARLIAEAPNMLELIKRGLAIDVDAHSGHTCPCDLCAVAREIIQRIEGDQDAQ